MSKYYPYHQRNGHNHEDCWVFRDVIYDLVEAKINEWDALLEKIRCYNQAHNQLQIHNNPLPNHNVIGTRGKH